MYKDGQRYAVVPHPTTKDPCITAVKRTTTQDNPPNVEFIDYNGSLYELIDKGLYPVDSDQQTQTQGQQPQQRQQQQSWQPPQVQQRQAQPQQTYNAAPVAGT